MWLTEVFVVSLETSPVNGQGRVSVVNELRVTAASLKFWLSFSALLFSSSWIFALDNSADFLCLLVLFSVEEALVLLAYNKRTNINAVNRPQARKDQV